MVESALVVLLIAVANAVSLVLTSGAFLDAGWAAQMQTRSLALGAAFSYVFLWLLVGGAILALLADQSEDLGGVLAVIGWGFAPAVVPALARLALVNAGTPAPTPRAFGLGGVEFLLSVLGILAVVWQWYVTFGAVRVSYDVSDARAAFTTGVPFGLLLVVGTLGPSLGGPHWQSIGLLVAFFGLAMLVAPQLMYDLVVRPMYYRILLWIPGMTMDWEAKPWHRVLLRSLGVLVGGAGFLMVGGATYVV